MCEYVNYFIVSHVRTKSKSLETQLNVIWFETGDDGKELITDEEGKSVDDQSVEEETSTKTMKRHQCQEDNPVHDQSFEETTSTKTRKRRRRQKGKTVRAQSVEEETSTKTTKTRRRQKGKTVHDQSVEVYYSCQL